jgi:hypothetical protein
VSVQPAARLRGRPELRGDLAEAGRVAQGRQQRIGFQISETRVMQAQRFLQPMPRFLRLVPLRGRRGQAG